MARRFLTFLVSGLAVFLHAAPAQAQSEATLFAPVPLSVMPPVARGALIVSQESARRALALGFAATAAAQAERLVVGESVGSAGRDAAVLLLASARLELGDIDGAGRALEEHSEDRSPAYLLRAGLVAARRGNVTDALAVTAELKPELLVEDERPWYYLLQGMVAEAARDVGKAGAAYDQSLAVATSDWQRARLRLTRERLRLSLGEATEEQATELRRQADRYAGRGVGTEYAVQYAVALSLLGRGEAATNYLQAHLAGLTETGAAGSRDDVRLLIGLVAGPDRATGRVALEQLLSLGTDPAKQRMALYLLSEGARSVEARARLRGVLDGLLGSAPVHALTEEFLLARAELSLADGAYAPAEADARDLLGRFPGSVLRARALTQLASVAWELKRFRTAADYAGQAAAATKDGEAGSALRLLAAEAWYRAAEAAVRAGGAASGMADYTTAAETYAVVVPSPPAGVAAADVMFQAVMAEIGAARLDKAAEQIDRFEPDSRFDATIRWQAEWNLARALQQKGLGEQALARVARLRAEPDAQSRPAALRARLAWLQARLARETGRAEEALRLAREAPGQLGQVEEGLAREIAGLDRLVAAEALFDLNRAGEAVDELGKLREEMAGSEPALLSYLVEADIRASGGGLVESQRLLTRFADDHRDHPRAPYALWQAALNAERRGEDVFYRDAYVLLEQLVNMPNPEAAKLIFEARMKQGDLLRRLGDFVAAQRIYEEELIYKYAQHPDVLLAQMALADCHRALAAREASHFESAISILERLRDLANAPLDLRAEAGFKLGDMLTQRGPGEALAAWGPVADALAIDPARTEELGVRGRYWLGRLLVSMASLLDAQGRPDEAGEFWRLVIARGLPGVALARARLNEAAAPAP